MKENENLPIEEETIQTNKQETSPTTDPAVTPASPKPKKKHTIRNIIIAVVVIFLGYRAISTQITKPTDLTKCTDSDIPSAFWAAYGRFFDSL